MAVEFKDSETKKNLMRAFAGESQARNRYTIAASECRKQGYPVLSEVFLFTAEQEREHAELYYQYLKEFVGETICVDGGYPVDLQTDLVQLLRAAAHNEYEEYNTEYKKFEEKAKEEGFPKIAAQFRLIGEVEKVHGDRFGMFSDMLEQDTMFVSETPTSWMCLNCGYIYEGTKVPKNCPTCKEEQGYFVRLDLAPYASLTMGK